MDKIILTFYRVASILAMLAVSVAIWKIWEFALMSLGSYVIEKMTAEPQTLKYANTQDNILSVAVAEENLGSVIQLTENKNETEILTSGRIVKGVNAPLIPPGATLFRREIALISRTDAKQRGSYHVLCYNLTLETRCFLEKTEG